MRAQLLFEPTNDLSFRLIGDFAERDEVCCAAVELIRGPRGPLIDGLSGGALSQITGGPFDRVTAATPGRGYDQDVRDWGLSLKSAWDLGGVDIASITAYRRYRLNRSQDGDLGPADILFRPTKGFISTFETFSKEINVTGEIGPVALARRAFFLERRNRPHRSPKSRLGL